MDYIRKNIRASFSLLPNNYKFGSRIVFIFIFLLAEILSGKGYFVPVEPTGLPYTIIVSSLKINGNTPPEGSEIGVFDDTLCVGAGLYYQDSSLIITAWKGDPGNNLPGFTSGHPMQFRSFITINGIGTIVNLEPVYEIGNGSFGFGVMTVLRLSGHTTTGISSENKNESKESISVYPNPFNLEVKVDFRKLNEEKADITIFDFNGRSIKETSISGSKQFVWDSRNNDGQIVSSGIYLIRVSTHKESIVKQVLLLK